MTGNEERFVNEKLVKSYAKGRPTYPPKLFQRLASLTPQHERAWDVGTGNGQAAIAVAEHYTSVIATDVSKTQLGLAMPRSNITYAQMSATPSAEELERVVGPQGSVDLVTVAAALHWFDLEKFYPVVKHILRKPGGVFAAWCYFPEKVRVCPDFEAILGRWFESGKMYRSSAHLSGSVASLYSELPFPFDPVPGVEAGTGVEGHPEDITMDKDMTLDDFIELMKSFSTVQVARSKGVDLLNETTIEELSKAWGAVRVRKITFPIGLLMGTVSTAPA